MSEHTERQSSFADEPPQDLVEYKRISLLAVGALIGGMASVLAVTSPLMWTIPVLTTALSLGALTVIAKHPDTLLGRKAALIGLWLALLIGSFAITNSLTRNAYLYHDAQTRSRQWLQVTLEGRIQESHQLQMDLDSRRSPTVTLADYYKHNEEAQEDLTGYEESESIDELKRLGPSAEIKLIANLDVTTKFNVDTRTDVITQRFAIRGDGEPKTLVLDVKAERNRDPETGEIYWRIDGAEPYNSPRG